MQRRAQLKRTELAETRLHFHFLFFSCWVTARFRRPIEFLSENSGALRLPRPPRQFCNASLHSVKTSARGEIDRERDRKSWPLRGSASSPANRWARAAAPTRMWNFATKHYLLQQVALEPDRCVRCAGCLAVSGLGVTRGERGGPVHIVPHLTSGLGGRLLPESLPGSKWARPPSQPGNHQVNDWNISSFTFFSSSFLHFPERQSSWFQNSSHRR